MKKAFLGFLLFFSLFVTRESLFALEETTVEFLYDGAKNRIQMKDGQGITSYRYDKKNRLIQITFPTQKTIEFAYNDQDKVTKVVYPNQKSISYDYDANGRIKTIEAEEGITSLSYNKERLSKIKRPSGITTYYLHNDALFETIHRKEDGSLLAQFRLAANPQQRSLTIFQKTENEEIESKYFFDPSYRLVERKDSTGYFERFTYDPKGLLIKKELPSSTLSYLYDEKGRLCQADDTYFYYDEKNNLSRKVSPKETTAYFYDELGRLSRFENLEKRVDFGYNGDGLLVWKRVDGIQFHYLRDALLPIKETLIKIQSLDDELFAKLYKYVLGAEKEEFPTYYVWAGQKLGAFDDEKSFSYLYDKEDGHLALLLDKNQKLLHSFTYDFIGMPLKKSQPLEELLCAEDSYDPETHLLLAENQYFDSELENFITPKTSKSLWALRATEFLPEDSLPKSPFSLALLFEKLNDPKGMVFDEEHFQLILFGKKNPHLSQLQVEDFAFLLPPGQRNRQNSSSSPTLAEAAQLLQNLELGEDFSTKKPLKVSVSQYVSLFDRYQELGLTGNYLSSLLFQPASATLLTSADKKIFLLDQISFSFQNSRSSAMTKEFEEEFLQHYEEYAHHFPVLEKIKIMTKWATFAKWVQQNGLALEFSLCSSFHSTLPKERRTRWMEYKKVSTESKNWYGGKKKKTKICPEEKTFCLTCLGEISLSPQQLMEERADLDPWTTALFQARPSTETTSWSFEGPDRIKYEAVCLPLK